jgi:beta-glucosidase
MGFMFATGIENSNPTIKNGSVRHDQLESCGFYKHWRADFELVREVGVDALRYGPPLHTTWRAPGLCDWSFADETLKALQGRVEVIADLCHFGVPDWLGNFQNPDLPSLFADYAHRFAKRYPWIRYYTPVNEMLICALFSARFGWWNEQTQNDKCFVRAVRNIVMANVKAMRAVIEVRPDAKFIQAEACEFTHAECDLGVARATLKNDERFLTLDLNYSHPLGHRMREFVMDCGLSRTDYDWFMANADLKEHCIVGHDYYVTSEGLIRSNGDTCFAEDVCGFHELALQYHRRYGLPAMHTETNMAQGSNGDEAVKWLNKQWRQTKFAMNQHDVPVIGFTWYSLTDQTDWECALREKNGTVNPLGLYDLDRNIRPVGRAFKELITANR